MLHSRYPPSHPPNPALADPEIVLTIIGVLLTNLAVLGPVGNASDERPIPGHVPPATTKKVEGNIPEKDGSFNTTHGAKSTEISVLRNPRVSVEAQEESEAYCPFVSVVGFHGARWQAPYL